MNILIVEDNVSCSEMLHTTFTESGWQAAIAATGTKALEMLDAERFDAIILDINIPGVDGFEVLRKIRSMKLSSKTIVVSGSIGVMETVRALKLGAVDCLPKPFKIRDLVALIKKIETSTASGSQSEMVAVSDEMCQVKELVNTVAKRNCTVLVTGETGTGKEVIARRLHRASDRRDKPFVAVNCSAIPVSLIESELFGHEKGAFTDARNSHSGFFETAADGTIFLDEIGDLPLELQSKLLRVLQEKTYRRVGGTQEIKLEARVLAATNVDLADAASQGKFREDLYYRLAVIPIHLTPLRERKADIIPLAERFLEHFKKEQRNEMLTFTDLDKERLTSHPWPGNVRELRNVVERFAIMHGCLEFVSSTRNLKKGTTIMGADDKPIKENEREMLLTMLLAKLKNHDLASLSKGLLAAH